MDVSAWLVLGAGAALVIAVAAFAAYRVARDPVVRALIASFRGLGPKRQWRLALRLLRDRRVPRRARLVPLALVLYLMLPFDLIPDFLPVIGQLDDLLIVVLSAWVIARLVPADVIAEHRRAVLASEPPQADASARER